MSLTNLGRWSFLRNIRVDYDYHGTFLSVQSTCQIKAAVVVHNRNSSICTFAHIGSFVWLCLLLDELPFGVDSSVNLLFAVI